MNITNFKIEFESVVYEEPKVIAFEGIGAEAMLARMLSEQVAAEVDRGILSRIRTMGYEDMSWEVNVQEPTPYPNLTQEALAAKINEVSNTIARNQRQSSANWVIMGSENAERFRDALGNL